MREQLIGLGFTEFDFLSIFICMLMGACAGGLKAALLLTPLDVKPTKDNPNKGNAWRAAFNRIDWMLGWFIVGAFTGLTISLLFLGTITKEPSSLARLAVLSALAGFIGPTLWKKQEETITKIIDKKLRTVLGTTEDSENNR